MRCEKCTEEFYYLSELIFIDCNNICLDFNSEFDIISHIYCINCYEENGHDLKQDVFYINQ